MRLPVRPTTTFAVLGVAAATVAGTALPASAATPRGAAAVTAPASELQALLTQDLTVHDYALGSYISWHATKGAGSALVNTAKAQLLASRQLVAKDIGGTKNRAVVLAAVSRLDDAIVAASNDYRPGINPQTPQARADAAAVPAAASAFGVVVASAVPGYLQASAAKAVTAGAAADLRAATFAVEGNSQAAPAQQIAATGVIDFASAIAAPLAKDRKLSGSTTLAASGIFQQLTALFDEHVEQTGIWIKAAAGQGVGSDAASDAFVADDTNAEYLAQDFGALFGSDAEKSFLSLWRDHLTGYAEYLDGKKTHDSAEEADGDTIVRTFATKLATLFNAELPAVPTAQWQSLFLDHVLGTEKVIDAALAHSATQFSLAAEGVAHFSDTAELAAEAIAAEGGLT